MIAKTIVAAEFNNIKKLNDILNKHTLKIITQKFLAMRPKISVQFSSSVAFAQKSCCLLLFFGSGNVEGWLPFCRCLALLCCSLL